MVEMSQASKHESELNIIKPWEKTHHYLVCKTRAKQGKAQKIVSVGKDVEYSELLRTLSLSEVVKWWSY